MGRCSVLGCRMKTNKKHPNITLHRLPTCKKRKEQWLDILGIENLNIKTKSIFVCSLHFEDKSFNRTLTVTRLHDDALPSRELLFPPQCDESEEEQQSVSLRVLEEPVYSTSNLADACRICLEMDAKLVSMRIYKLEQAYENLTGISLSEADKLPQKLCMECVQRLLNCSRFRHKSLRANSLMLEVIEKQDCLTVQSIKTINRINNQLTSILSTKHFEVNHYDSYFECEDQSILIQDESSTTANVYIEEENEIVLTEVIPDKNDDGLDETGVNDPGFDDDGFGDTDVDALFEKDDVSEKEYVLSDSSDDSLSLEKCETKKVRKRKQKDDKPVNHYDSYFEYEDQSILIQDESSTTANFDIEEENEIVLTEEIPDKNDVGLDESGVSDPGFGDTDADALFEKDDVSENEYVLSDSSDDSLSLEKCETKKTRKRKQKDEKPVKTAKRAKKIQDPTQPKIDRRRKSSLNDDLNEALFTITDLTFEEQIAEIVKRQESSNYKNAVYKCTVCFKGFLDEDAYNSHMTRHTNQSGEHECKICKMHFKHPYALRKHLTGLHAQRFSCKRCTYVTTIRATARMHGRWHNGTKYCCPHCPEEFGKITTYMNHIRIKHPSNFVCGLCGYSFVSTKGLEQHKKIKHRFDNVQIPEDGPLCELCNVRFISSEAHKRHLRVSPKHFTGTDIKRESNKPKKAKKSKERKELERRARDKDGDSNKKRRIYPSQMRAEGPIPCEQCGVQLQSSGEYHRHFRQMHPEKNRTNFPSMTSPYMCEVCGKILSSYAHLKDHTRIHTDERPFKCDSCDKSFRLKQYLLSHKLIHSEVRTSYECAVCGKHFSNKANRQRHMIIHTGLKPFNCEMCGKAFKSIPEKRLHITYVHHKKPWPKRNRGKRRPKTRQDQLPPQDQDSDSQAPMSPPCDSIDQEIEIEMGDMSPIIEDKPVIYILKI